MAIPAEFAQVVARRDGSPLVIVVRDIHVDQVLRSAGEPGEASAVAHEVLQVIDLLAEADNSTHPLLVAAEGLFEPVTREDLLAMVPFAPPELGLLLELPAAERRATAFELLRSGSMLPVSLTAAAAWPERVQVVGVETLQTVEQMLDVAPKVDELEQATDEIRDDLLILRARVMAGAAVASDLEAYRSSRQAAFALLDEFDRFTIHQRSATMARNAVALADSAGHDGIVLVAGGFHTSSILAELETLEVGYLVVEPHSYTRLALEYEPWLAALRAHVPSAPSRREALDLPAIDAWAEAFAPAVQAFRASSLGETSVLERARTIVEAEPVPSLLAADDPRRASIAAAAERLAELLRRDSTGTLREFIGEPLARLPQLELRGMRDDKFMGYNAYLDTLHVHDEVAQLSIDEVAAVLAHELVHVHDASAMAAAMGCTREEFALTLNALPRTVGYGWILVIEDRASRVELEVARALGLQFAPANHRREPLAPSPRLRASWGAFDATSHDRGARLQMLADILLP